MRRLLAPRGTFPHDLHVLGTPPAFVLSQDQTLQLKVDAVGNSPITCLLTNGVPSRSFKLVFCLARRIGTMADRHYHLVFKDRPRLAERFLYATTERESTPLPANLATLRFTRMARRIF